MAAPDTRAAPATGLLLVNLGTPDAPTPRAVRRYLRQFLGDPLVLDVHPALRAFLLHAVILPFRPRRSAHAYRQIWTDAGSPLLVHGRALRDAVERALGDGFRVALGMRYGSPSLESALAELLASPPPRRLVVIPLFPQFSMAASGSALALVREALRAWPDAPPAETVECFPDHPAFVRAVATVARPVLADAEPEHVLFSYHGLPERQVRRADPTGAHCLVRADCCDVLGPANRLCYRAQCFATTRAVGRALGLAAERRSTAFQSRLGRDPWIQPFTDRTLETLAAHGVRRLAVLCPSFVADCLETLEEIGLRARARWSELGGRSFALVPCVNADPSWVEGVVALVRERLQSPPPGEPSAAAAEAPEASASESATPSR